MSIAWGNHRPPRPSAGFRRLAFWTTVLLLAASPAAAGEKPSRAAGASHLDLSNAYAYPVPYKPSQSTRKQISFINLSAEATIRVYNSDGELVTTLTESDGDGILRWDVTDDGGAPLGSDVYFYVIENSEQTRTGKLMVIR